MEAPRDDNRIPAGLATNDNSARATQALKVDPVTRRLLITITGSIKGTTQLNSQPLQRDENRVPVGAGVSDNSARDVIPLHINAATGYLAVDLLNE